MIPNEIIFVVGYTGSGKSFLSNKLKSNGYKIISTDDIIVKYLMKDSTDTIHFLIYSAERMNKVIESKRKFIEIIKKIMSRYKKVVIEGQLHEQLINELNITNEKPNIILVKPKNQKSWLNNLTKRFESDPMNYGRIGPLKKLDKINENAGLNDYLLNGSDGKIISKMLKKVVKEKYSKHKLLLDYYKEKFGSIKIFLS